MRLANGMGTVFKLSGNNRRNPYVAKKFLRWETDVEKMTSKPIYEVIGYFRTKKDALTALMEYNMNPTDLTKKTFSEVYEEWAEKKYPSVSKSMASDYKGAYKYCKPVHDYTFKDITVYDLERVLTDPNIPRTYIHRMRVLLSQLYQYGIKHSIVTKNLAEMVEVKEDNAVRKETRLFTQEEIDAIFSLPETDERDMILVSLYTGMRPTEVCNITAADVDIDKRIIVGGIKTKAGIGRRIPIHSVILPLISERLKKGNISLFVTALGTPATYKTYRLWFNATISGHTPYDTRHSFASAWHTSGPNNTPLDPLIEKLVMGHSVSDITKGVYTHITDERLVEEIDKLHY